MYSDCVLTDRNGLDRGGIFVPTIGVVSNEVDEHRLGHTDRRCIERDDELCLSQLTSITGEPLRTDASERLSASFFLWQVVVMVGQASTPMQTGCLVTDLVRDETAITELVFWTETDRSTADQQTAETERVR